MNNYLPKQALSRVSAEATSAMDCPPENNKNNFVKPVCSRHDFMALKKAKFKEV